MPKADLRGLLAQIGELGEGIDGLKADVKGIDLKSGMLRTFEAAEAASLRGKLARALACLEASRDAKAADESSWQAERAARILNDVAASLAIEAAEFRAELIAFRSRRRYETDLARYDRSVERAHEKFLSVGGLLASIVAAIPKFL
jgi:hypothetical protein